MSQPTFSPDLTVAEVLKRWDQTAAAFIHLRMACVGCPMSAFETLETAAQIYGLLPETLIRELEISVATQLGTEQMGETPNTEEYRVNDEQ